MMQSVQVIIERLKTHPEDFFGGDEYSHRVPKFRDITDKLDDLLIDKKDVGHIHRLWYLEPEEKAALLEAYKEARRARFEANVFHTLLTNDENLNDALTYKAKGRYTTGIVAPQNMLKQAKEILDKEFEKEYAKISNTRP
jgi:hypothetical protein